jgi:hypothetical protein
LFFLVALPLRLAAKGESTPQSRRQQFVGTNYFGKR